VEVIHSLYKGSTWECGVWALGAHCGHFHDKYVVYFHHCKYFHLHVPSFCLLKMFYISWLLGMCKPQCILTKEDEKRTKQLDRVIKHVGANIY
jgi:hypothetical protein